MCATRVMLLQNMSACDYTLIEPHLVPCALPQRMSIERSGMPIEAVYFIERGVASIVAKHCGLQAETGIIGREGMTGAAVLMGNDSTPHECYMQLPGEGLKLDVSPFRDALCSSPTLRLFLLRFLQSLYVQTGLTAMVNAKCNIQERLARWLLMCADRTIGDNIQITHEFLSVMLGIRRPGVTIGLQDIEGMRLIRATRGLIEIRDRSGLEKVAARSGYGQAEAEYNRLLNLRPPSIPQSGLNDLEPGLVGRVRYLQS
jgi:CRP-like cAMP-binding protein